MHDLYSEDALSAALAAKWQAEALAGLRWWRQTDRPGLLSVPAEWTAWLLMHKAGVPRELIASCAGVHLDHVTRRLRLATAMMIFAPYAARIEALARRMPAFAPHQAAGGKPCAALAS